VLFGLWLSLVLGCGGQPTEDLQDGGSAGVPRPVFTGVTEGTGPLNDNNITVNGTAVATATVDLYSNSACTAFVSSALADGSGNFAFPVTVTDDTTNVFFARQTTPSGISACSTSFAVFVEDSSAATITLSSTPVSPANDNSPSLSGTTEVNSTILLYTDASCTVPATPASGTSNSSGVYSIGISVSDDTSTTYYAVLQDSALNVSACSAGYTYTEDSIDPPAPSTPVAAPAGPANFNAPVFSGTVAEPGVQVRLFSDASCSTLIASGTADGGGNYGITVNVADDTTTNVYWRSRDAAGNQSVCSAGYVTYIEDSGTVTPVITSSTPTSPSTNNNPTITGTAEANADVTLYTNAACTTQIGSPATASGGGAWNIAIAVSSDATTNLYAKAVDQYGNNSACSSVFAYVEDSTDPATPSLTSTSPATTGGDLTPDVTGSTSEAANITVYSNPGCSTVVGTGTSNGAGAFTINVTVASNTTTSLYARAVDFAGNASPACSSALNYIHDDVAPAAPTVASSLPATPSSSNNPTINGTAEANSTVRLYTNAGCTTQIGSSTTASGGGAWSIPVTGLASNATTNFYAQATDAAGNAGACSAAFAYVEDSTAPVPGSITSTSPASPSNDETPNVIGTAEAYGIIAVFADSSCVSTVYGTGSADGSGNFNFVLTSALPENAPSDLYLRVTDLAGNVGACSGTPFTFTEDSIQPIAPHTLASTPPTPTNDETPDITGITEANAQVYLYSDACTTQIASTTANGAGNFSAGISVANNAIHTIYARSRDVAGNYSSCSSVFNFEEDSTAPAAPAGLVSAPYLRSDSTAATIDGTAENLATVNVYSDAGCTTQVGSDAAGSGVFSASITAPLNQIISYYATATDVAGNTSACSAGFASYEAYSIPAGVGFFTGSQTNAGATPRNLNQAANNALQFSTADFDSATYTHSTTSNSHRVYVNTAGDYQVSLNLPGTGAVTAGALRLELYVNGTANTATRAQNFFVANTSTHRQSSIGATYLLENLNSNDYVEAIVRRHGAAGTIETMGTYGVYFEKIDPSRVIFRATASTGLTGGNINSPNTLAWTSTIKDSGFTHTNGEGGIQLDTVGTYVIHANIPATGAVTNASVKVIARVDGTPVSGGEAKQGYIPNASGVTASSMHWSGLVTTSTPNAVLTFGTAAEAAAGVVTVPAGYPATVFVERLGGVGNLFYGQGTNHVGGTDFNAVGPNAVQFTTENLEDGARFTHAIAGTSEQIQVNTFGDYLLMFNAQNTGAGARVNTRFQVTVNGTAVSGAQSNSFFLRNAGGHAESSGTMVYLLRRLNANDIVRVTQARDTAVVTATTNQNTSLMLIYKP